MKTKLLIIFTLFLSTNLFAQDWQMFNENYKTYYLQKDFFNRVWADYDKVYEIQFRKEKIAENHFVFLSNRIDSIYNSDSCLYEIRKSQNYFERGDDYLMIDRYEIRNDTLFYYLENYGIIIDSSKYIYFPLKLNPGDSLLINNIIIKFVEKKLTKIINGISDSVMVFILSIINDSYSRKDTLSLSKNYGILGLVSFKNIFAYDLIRDENINLIGLENLISQEHYGYEPKKMLFKDLIKYKAGDTRYWSFGNYDITWGEHRYYKDSIISVVEESDSLKLTCQRTSYYNNKPSSYREIVESYNIKDWEKLLSDRQNNMNAVYYDYWEYDYEGAKTSLILPDGYVMNKESSLDTLFDFSINPLCIEDFGTKISKDCELEYRSDNHSHNFYAQNVGLYFSYMFGTSNEVIWELIAYTLGGELHGKIPDKFYSVEDQNEQSILISPNPAADYIILNIPLLEKRGLGGVLLPIEIFNIFGKQVLSAETQCIASLQRIDITTLPAGLYFVKIGTEKPMKFVKM